MKLKYLAFAAFFIVLTFCACSTIKVSHIETNAIVPKTEGIYYSLPKTVVAVEVTVNKTYKIKGPYSGYARKYLGLSNVITENSTFYSIGDIQLKSYPVPDPDQFYYVQVPKGNKKSNSVFLKLSESGIISSINDIGINKPLLKPDSLKNESSDELADLPAQLSFKSNLAETIDTIIEKVNLDTISFEQKVLKKTVSEKTLEEQAKDAVDFIMRVKESRFNILTGYSEVNYSKESIEYMNEQLSKMEKEYLSLFIGKTVTHQLKYSFTYVPSNTENIIYLPLFRLSAKDGIVDTSNYVGESVYLRIERFGSTKQIATFEKAKQNITAKSHGFYYRIPEYAKVSLIYNDKVKTQSNILISQFGTVCELPAGKKLRATFYSNSGSLKSVAFKKKICHHFFHP